MTPRHVLIFEDAGWRGLYPITLSRPAFDCRVGGAPLARRLLAQLAHREWKQAALCCRPILRPLVERDYPHHDVNRELRGDTLFLNGRLLALAGGLDALLDLVGKSVALQLHGELVACALPGQAAESFRRSLVEALDQGEPAPFPPHQTVAGSPEDVRLARHPWDLVSWNTATIEDDFHWAREQGQAGEPRLAAGAQLLHKDHILARDEVQVEPGAILDARSGPIILGEGVVVEHNAVILGPAVIGPRTRIRMGARLYDGVSIGPVCKVGGEVEASILQGYTNKQHDGFLGHSYLGAWCNLGAATNTSDLKNNYSTVRAWTLDGEFDTGLQFVGLTMGDHSKTAIGTMLNTGTVVGFSCNVFGAGFPAKHLPSFTWGGVDRLEVYEVEKALQVARRVVGRRKLEMEPADEVLFRAIHAESRPGH